MRLTRIQAFLKQKGIVYEYWEEDDCGSIASINNGLPYRIWEYPAPERGAESNVRIAGRTDEYNESYEEEILNVLKEWR